MLDRKNAINLLVTKYRGQLFDDSKHAVIITFANGKQVATDKTEAVEQRRTFSMIVNSLPPKEVVSLDDVKNYPKGKEGGRNSNVTKKAAPELWWRDYDTWRIYLNTERDLEAVLDWYLDFDKTPEPTGGGLVSFGEPAGLTTPDTGKDLTQTISRDGEEPSAIGSDAQSSLDLDTRSLKTEEREAVVKVRFGQGSFREALLKENNHDEKCWMSGIEGKRLLIASHIKPWSHCKSELDSRGRTDNGLLLSALWDAAFDAGLISFDPDWKVVACSELTESARRALNVNEHSVLPKKFRTAGRKTYLAYHHEVRFEHWMKKDLSQPTESSFPPPNPSSPDSKVA